jgi:hypothetical protein
MPRKVVGGVLTVLGQPCEAVADGLGLPAVEAEDELLEVALQVLGPDGAVVGAEESALGIAVGCGAPAAPHGAEDEVDGGQARAGVAPVGGQVDGLVPVALGGKAAIAGPTVGGDGEPPCRVGGEEALEARGRGIRDRRQPQPAERALFAPAGPDAGPGATDQGFFDLDPVLQGLTVGADHGAADLVQPSPSKARTPSIRSLKGTRPAGRGGAVP